MDFAGRLNKLNKNQREAVDTIDGPVMVIAGPGTGKTELLGMRVANILDKTDTLPENILCLTFTESGAANMRDRLTRLIGQSAYKVNISTYHGFGGDMIRRYPEYFAEYRLQEPVDNLGQHQIISAIVDKMSYANPLKQARFHLKDLIGTISEVKRAMLTSDDLRAIAAENAAFIQNASRAVSTIFAGMERMPRKVDDALQYFEKTLEVINKFPVETKHERIVPLASLMSDSLQSAVENAAATNKTSPLTEWKNTYLKKDANNKFIVGGELENIKIASLADVLDQYQKALGSRGFYDFDDMIIRSIQVLGNNNDLKYTLQEQYQYLLLDEFQDTNTVQLRLVELLCDNPVHEGRPNVLAVGDDDQAIYAFQGAQYSNMLDFHGMFHDVRVINLSENYRSHADILLAAKNVAAQIDQRLHHKFDGMTKELTASNTKLPAKSHISRNDFLSDIAQYDWIAKKIQDLVDQENVDPKEIAVLAPKHKQLEPLVPFLNAVGIPVRYEKRENILEAPVVRQLLAMSKLVLAIKAGEKRLADALWPEVLSFDFWKIPTDKIWQLSWKVSDARDDGYNWNKAILEEDCCRTPALLLLALAGRADIEPLECMLDWLIGSQDLKTHDAATPKVISPLREYYTSPSVLARDPQLFYETLSHLKILRDKLRDFQKTQDDALMLGDLIAFVDMYREADEKLINTSPYNQDTNAVQIMTVFKAKGLEFQHVFLVSCIDEIWGTTSRGNSNRLTLPPNLAPIRHAGATNDERLRILFVALTRAKFGLYMTRYAHTYTGKMTKRLAYFDEQEQDDNTFKAMVLPPDVRDVQMNDKEVPPIAQLELDWRSRHVEGISLANLRSLLEERLQTYKLSPTHLNTFIDLEYGGPEAFFYKTLLKFPEAPMLSNQFGNAMHSTMEWIQFAVDEKESTPPIEDIVLEFGRQLKKQKMTREQEALELERGEKALSAYIRQRPNMFKSGDKAELNFVHEGVVLGDARMSGKIDRMEIDKDKKEIVVVDYKTGTPHNRWERTSKLHKYEQQLYCYKLLIENSRTYKGYTVTAGRLEFLEPDEDGKVHGLSLHFKEEKLNDTKALIAAVWKHINELSFPNITDYEANLKGIEQFEDDLLGKNLSVLELSLD